MIDERSIARIKNVLCVAEQGIQTIPYGKVEVMADGPNGIRQITLSIGFTQYGGNLGKVMQAYADSENGKYSSVMGPFVHRLHDHDIVNNPMLKELLKKAGNEDPIMGQVQEDKFVELYLEPAIKWGHQEGFTLPFSYLIICDSYLHSGSVLVALRNKFKERTPVHGGDEKTWITEYLNARHEWLSHHSNHLIRTSSYRTKYYKELLALDDWPLDKIGTIAMNGVKPLSIA